MRKIKPEYGLAIIKPDGVKKEINSLLEEMLEKEKLETVVIKKVKLLKEEVMNNFTSDFDIEKYSNYISSGDITGYLVKGHYSGQILRDLKQKLRLKFGYTSIDMENLIHTADNGNEYNFQFKLIFPELNISEYSKFADMNLKFDGNINNLLKDLENLNDNSNLSWIGITLKHEDLTALEYIEDKYSFGMLIGIVKEFQVLSNKVNIIGYIEPELLKNDKIVSKLTEIDNLSDYSSLIQQNNGITVLDYIVQERIDLTLLNTLKSMGVSAVTIYDPRRTMSEVEALEELVEDGAQLSFSGGSGGMSQPGEFSIDRWEFEELTKRMKLKLKQLN